jgi:hypothetical protein
MSAFHSAARRPIVDGLQVLDGVRADRLDVRHRGEMRQPARAQPVHFAAEQVVWRRLQPAANHERRARDTQVDGVRLAALRADARVEPRAPGPQAEEAATVAAATALVFAEPP